MKPVFKPESAGINLLLWEYIQTIDGSDVYYFKGSKGDVMIQYGPHVTDYWRKCRDDPNEECPLHALPALEFAKSFAALTQ